MSVIQYGRQEIFDMTHASNPVQSLNTEKCHTLTARMGTGGNQVPVLHEAMTVRRLTPTECERLQGLPDGYTNVPCNGKSASDAKRYKAIGNGMAQPCADFVISQIVNTVAPQC